MSESDSGLFAITNQGDQVEIIETYLTSDHVWVRNSDGTTKVVRTSDIQR